MRSNEHYEVFYANGVKGFVAKSMAGWGVEHQLLSSSWETWPLL